jgi:hypothetical protein
MLGGIHIRPIFVSACLAISSLFRLDASLGGNHSHPSSVPFSSQAAPALRVIIVSRSLPICCIFVSLSFRLRRAQVAFGLHFRCSNRSIIVSGCARLSCFFRHNLAQLMSHFRFRLAAYSLHFCLRFVALSLHPRGLPSAAPGRTKKKRIKNAAVRSIFVSLLFHLRCGLGSG